MTWGEWVESEYNIDGWYINSSMDVVQGAHESSAIYYSFESANRTTVKASELIIAEKEYILGSY